MELLRKSKTVSWLADILRVRPIVFAAIGVLIADILYVNWLYPYPAQFDSKGQYMKKSGIVRDKEYSAEGNVSKITVGDVLCYVNINDIGIGDEVEVSGRTFSFCKPKNLGEFNQKSFYASKKIFKYQYTDSIKVTSHASFSVRDYFKSLRHRLSLSVMDSCPYEGGTVNTLLLGEKTFLESDRKELYQKAGVAHFLVISGLHISAVGSFIYRALLRLGIKRKRACVSAFVFLLAYGIITGFGVSVIRAVVMFAVRLLADIVGRSYDMLNALSFAAIVTIFVNPLSILDTAFAYSYATVFAIAVYTVYIHPRAFMKKGIWRKLREGLRIPAILCLFVMPVTLRLSYSYSLFSIIINAVLAPLSAPILFISALCLLTSLTGFISVSRVFETVLHSLLSLIDTLCGIGTKLPLFTLTGRPSVIKLVIYYFLLLVYFFYVKENGSLWKKLFFLINAMIFVGTSVFFVPKVTMLYVGQGECIVVRTGTDSAVMFDCGSSSEKDIGKYTVLPFLKASGIRVLNSVIMTHADIDHVNGMEALFEESGSDCLRINRFVIPDSEADIKSEHTVALLKKAKEKRIPVTLLKRGAKASFGAFSFECLSPLDTIRYEDTNDSSLVCLADYIGFSMLFTGDSSSSVEEDILSKSNITADILKVAHHGSGSSSSDAFLKAGKFRKAVISAGINNSYHHPSAYTVNRLSDNNIQWFCTKDCGMIEIILGHIFCPFMD